MKKTLILAGAFAGLAALPALANPGPATHDAPARAFGASPFEQRGRLDAPRENVQREAGHYAGPRNPFLKRHVYD